MLIKSALATQMSGSIGGMTASHNKGGMYLRGRGMVTNPNSTAQQLARAAMTELVDAWNQTLTDSQRDGWRTYAANVQVTNRLGDQINVSGQNMYVRLNQPRIVAALPRVDDAPAIFAGAELGVVSVTAAAGSGYLLDVNFDDTADWVNEDDAALIIQGSRPQNAAIEFFKGPFRFGGTVEGDSVTAPTSPVTLTMPFAGSDNQRVFARVRLSRADGRLSAPQVVTAIIA